MTHAVSGIDHIAVTVNDLTQSIAFYRDKLGARVVNEYKIGDKVAVVQVLLGGAMMNVHCTDHGHPLVAKKPTPGAVDLCFRWKGGAESAKAFLEKAGVAVIEGPVPRDASDGKQGKSVYFRDPDGNLLEFLSTD